LCSCQFFEFSIVTITLYLFTIIILVEGDVAREDESVIVWVTLWIHYFIIDQNRSKLFHEHKPALRS